MLILIRYFHGKLVGFPRVKEHEKVYYKAVVITHTVDTIILLLTVINHVVSW